jgi:hypothetical protein
MADVLALKSPTQNLSVILGQAYAFHSLAITKPTKAAMPG